MTSPTTPITRIEKILDHIHQNIKEPLSLEGLAKQSYWSRWQLQRVFKDYTGYSVAQYVREIKLSRCAELLVRSDKRIMDIAFEFSFSSDITFSRSFKAFFNLSPKDYRAQGLLTGIKMPMERPGKQYALNPGKSLYQVRLERGKAFDFTGMPFIVRGMLSGDPDFQLSIPNAWQEFFSHVPLKSIMDIPHIGLINSASSNTDSIQYWPGVFSSDIAIQDNLSQRHIVALDYAVLTYQGPLKDLHKAVSWLIASWLPNSGYSGLDDIFEIEIYYPPYESSPEFIQAEYWLPLTSQK